MEIFNVENGLGAVFFVDPDDEEKMGRRVLPKMDDSIDFSHLVGEVDDLVAPFDPQSLFGQPGKLEIEVGAGKGLFLLNETGCLPDHNFLGNEIAAKYCRFAAYRLVRSHRNNVFMLRGDGIKLFREFLPSQCAVAVHVYFPDPWWKARHRRRRVITPGFVHDVQRILSPRGVFHFWTDVEEYFDEACQLIQRESDLSGPHDVRQREASHDLDYRTHFERRMRQNDHPVFRSTFIKESS